jgi:hypothetical protein
VTTRAEPEDEYLDTLLRTQMLVRDEALADWDLERTAVAVREEILSRPGHAGRAQRDRWADFSTGRFRRRGAFVAAAAVVVACVISGVSVIGRHPGDGAYAAQVVASAQASPRLLIDDPAWKVTGVLFDESTPQTGEMRFTGGDQHAQVNWYPIGLLPGYVADRRPVSTVVGHIQVFGHPAELLGPNTGAKGACCEVLTALNDKIMVDFSGPRSVMGKLDTVDVRRWLDALPATVFTGDRRDLAVEDMLAGLPKPPGYDPTPVQAQALNSDRYQLGAAVVASVGCAWFMRWFDARDRHDQVTADEASQVLRESRDWPVMRQIQSQGDYPMIFKIQADRTHDGVKSRFPPLTRSGLMTTLGCTGPR